MTTLEVSISEEVEGQLRQRATARGVPLEEYARTVLERDAAVSNSDPNATEWVAEWRAWTASHSSSTHCVDDSRDSIYEGCGE